MKEILILATLLFTSLGSFAKSPNDEAFENNYDIDPRDYAIVLIDDFYGKEETGPRPEFQLPSIEFYDNKKLNGSPVASLSRKGLELNGKLVCPVYRISKGKYDVLYESERTTKDYESYLYDFREYFETDPLAIGEKIGGTYKLCSFVKNSQRANYNYKSILILEDLDEKSEIATIKVNSKDAYFSIKNLKHQTILRPPVKELEHWKISLVDLAKEIEKGLMEFRQKFLSRVSGNEKEKLKNFNDVYREKEPENFSVSSLDWMDKYSEQGLKKRLIENFKETRFLRHFDFYNSYVFVAPSYGKKNGKVFVDAAEIILDYDNFRLTFIKIDKATGRKDYFFTFDRIKSVTIGSHKERIIPDFDMSDFKKYMK